MSERKRGNPNWQKGGPSPNPSGRKRQRQERRDGWINHATGHGTARDRRTLTRYGLDVVTDIEALHLWRSEWLCAKVIETRPKEAFRRGFDVDLGNKDKAEDLMAVVEELGVVAAMVKAIQYERAFGGAAIFPVLAGALGDLSLPLDEGAITEVTALHVLEPRELYPHSYYESIGHPKFGRPEVYRLQPLTSGRVGSLGAQLIHESRLIIFPGIRVSRQTQPGQRESWGDSELSRPLQLISDLGLSIGSATTILNNYGRDVLKLKGWAELAAMEGSGDAMSRRLASFDMMNSALRMGVLDAEDEISVRGGQSLSGIDNLLTTQAHFVAAAVDIPISVLLDMAPGSLNATGDMNVRNWYATIENDQSTKYERPLERLLKLIMLSSAGPLGGKEPDLWSVKWRPLWSPSEKETAETRLLDAQRAKILVEAGIASADDIANSFYGGDTYSSEVQIDWAAREAQKKIDEERAADMDAAAIAALGRQPQPGQPPEPGDDG
jgi:uncharacterized protein